MKDTLFYKIVKPLLMIVIKLYRPTVIGKENIPQDESFILAGNHTKELDVFLVAANVKRQVHYFAKDSLYNGWKKPIFKALGIIPVDRSKKDPNSLRMGIEALNNNLVVGIFPEGTFNRTKDLIMPFKFGAVKMAHETKKMIVPFAIVNKYKFLRKSVIIRYGKPYYLESDDLEKENNILMDKVRELIILSSK